MEKLNAIAQISVLLIVAFLIGFITSWLYWRSRYRQMANSYEDKINQKDKDLARLKNEMEGVVREKNETLRQLQKDEKKLETLEKDFVPEKLYRLIVKDVGEGISVSDEEGYFLVFNPKLEEITGYSRSEANQQKRQLFLDKLYPDLKLRKTVAEHIDHIPENHEYTNIRTVIKSKSGEDKAILVSSTMIDYKEKKYYLTAYRDMSKKPEMEKTNM